MNPNESAPLPLVVAGSKHRISMVWLIPLLAAAIAGYLAYDAIQSRGVPITLVFNDGSGLAAGKTPIKFNGLPVGMVQSFEVGPGMRSVIVHATLDKTAAGAAVQGTTFWVVRPEMNISGVTGLDALVTGAYIAFNPGQNDAQPQFHFTGLNQTPPADTERPGITVHLKTSQAGSLNVGSPIYYRQLHVGVVRSISLSDTSQHLLIDLHIDDAYKNLIRTNTIFWNVSGINFSLGLLGIGAHLNVESLESLLAGGIALATPDEPGERAPLDQLFELQKEQKDEYLQWSPAIPLAQAQSSQDADSPLAATETDAGQPKPRKRAAPFESNQPSYRR